MDPFEGTLIRIIEPAQLPTIANPVRHTIRKGLSPFSTTVKGLFNNGLGHRAKKWISAFHTQQCSAPGSFHRFSWKRRNDPDSRF
ncbi:MAG: hypothetical protein KDJ29_14470, partial [Hyphomicrobiales bacterium]|nr:hypothetical protein [Hyphomicrobiales bacterium]